MTSNSHIWQGTGNRVLAVFAFISGLIVAAPFVLLLAAPFMPGL